MSGVEHPVVVEWTSAAERSLWHDHAVAGGFQDFRAGLHGLRVEVVVEGVREEDDRGRVGVDGAAFLEPVLERLGGEGRHVALRGYAAELLDDVSE